MPRRLAKALWLVCVVLFVIGVAIGPQHELSRIGLSGGVALGFGGIAYQIHGAVGEKPMKTVFTAVGTDVEGRSRFVLAHFTKAEDAAKVAEGEYMMGGTLPPEETPVFESVEEYREWLKAR